MKFLCSLQSLDELECLKHALASLDFELQVDGKASSSLAVSHNSLGMAYVMNAEWQKAKEQLERSKAVREELPGHTRDENFPPLYYLALMHHSQGDDGSAEFMLHNIVEDCAQALPSAKPHLKDVPGLWRKLSKDSS